MPPHHFQMQVRAFLVFIQIQILFFLHLIRFRPQQQAAPAPPPQPPPAPARARWRHTCWVQPYIIHHEEKGAYHNLLADLYDFDVPGFTNFMRMTPEFFEMIKARVHPHLVRQATNYRGPLSVGLKLAITQRFLATGESYQSLSYQFMVGRSSISKFVPKVCRAIKDEFLREYVICPTTPDTWKQVEREFNQEAEEFRDSLP